MGEQFFLAVDVANVVCALMLGAQLLAGFPRSRAAQLIAALSLAAAAHVLLGRVDYGRWSSPAFRLDVGGWYPLLNLARNAAPGLFMLLVFRLFADRGRLPPWLLAVFAVQMLLEALPQDRFDHAVTQTAPALLQLLFAGFAVWWTLADWRADLVEARRRLRAVMLVVLAVDMVASSLLLRVLIAPGSLANYRAHLVLSLVNLAIVAVLLLRVRGFEALEPRALPQPRTPDDALPRLLALMEYERVWNQPGLTLAALAQRLNLPQYRLRALIHEGLGHRNFNAFLHQYRIREACARMADPAQRRTPILTIALSVGYNSVNTFNRGFREVMGTTPSAWRGAGQAATGAE